MCQWNTTRLASDAKQRLDTVVKSTIRATRNGANHAQRAISAARATTQRSVNRCTQRRRVKYVNPEDYANGTVILSLPNTRYILTGNVKFGPNPENDFMPTEQQYEDGVYNRRATQLGFTTSTQIVGDNIEFDMNGYTIEQTFEYYLAQRFYSHVQLGGSPFSDAVGPVDFVEGEFVTATNPYVHDGVLGRSSHHGIQGNQCASGFRLENMVIRDFEVAAVSINAVEDMVVERCSMGPNNSTQVVVNSAWSQARFIRLFLRSIRANPSSTAEAIIDATAKLNALNLRMDSVLVELLATGTTTDALFGNPSGASPGSAYALLVHGKGPAVNDFSTMPAEEDDTEDLSRRLMVRKVDMNNIHAAPVQVTTLTAMAEASDGDPSGVYGSGVQHDPAGGVLDLLTVWDRDTDLYVPNELADAQACVAAYREFLESEEVRSRVTFSPSIVAWMRTPGALLADAMTADNVYPSYNGDAMSHVMKGVIGMRLDRTVDVVCENVTISSIRNSGEQATDIDGEELTGNGETNPEMHSQQTLSGYQGAPARGISMSACKDVRLLNVTIDGVRSDNAYATGLDVMNETEMCVINDSLAISRVVGVSAELSNDTQGTVGECADDGRRPDSGRARECLDSWIRHNPAPSVLILIVALLMLLFAIVFTQWVASTLASLVV